MIRKAAFLVVFAALFANGGPAAAEDATRLVETVLKTPTSDLAPSLAAAFMKVDIGTLPKRLRPGASAKQLEIQTLLKVHDTKKKGSVLQPVEGCRVDSFVKPTKELPFYQLAGWTEEITEDDERAVMNRTLCTEADLGCHFTLIIFADPGSKNPRRLFLMSRDPLMALIAAMRNHVGGGNYFMSGAFSCMR